MGESRRAFLPATGRDWLLPFYDPLVRLLGGDAVRADLLAQADFRPGHRILDIGCGTGSLLILIKRRHLEVAVVGLDPDPSALARARRKAARAGVAIQFDQGFSDELPYPPASFDLVFSSFMLHHLRPEEKEKTLREVRRILKPDGSFHLLDFAGQGSHRHGLHCLLIHMLPKAHRPADDHDGPILALLSAAGFAGPAEVSRRTTRFGRVAYFRASAASGVNHSTRVTS